MDTTVLSRWLSWSLKVFGVEVARLQRASDDCVGRSACVIALLQELTDAREDELCTWSDAQVLSGYMDDLLVLLGYGVPFLADASSYRDFSDQDLLGDLIPLNVLREMISREMSGLQRVRLDVNSMAEKELPLIRFVRCLFARDESAGMDWLRDFCTTVDGFVRAKHNPIPDILLNLHLVCGSLHDKLKEYSTARDVLTSLEIRLGEARLKAVSPSVSAMLDDSFFRCFGAKRKGL